MDVRAERIQFLGGAQGSGARGAEESGGKEGPAGEGGSVSDVVRPEDIAWEE
jgi:hypothetical protein